jgi:hypothetical protein
LFTPVVLAGTLTVPLFAGAHENQGNKHRWPAQPAAPAATTTVAEPQAAAPVEQTATAPVETQTTQAAPAAPAQTAPAPVVDQPAADAPSDAAEPTRQAAAVTADDQLDEAPGFVADSVRHDDDHGDDHRGKGKAKGKGKGKSRGHAYGHDKGHDDNGHHYGQDKGHDDNGQHNGHDKGDDDHGHDKGDDNSSGPKSESAPAAASAPAQLQPIASPSLAGLANQVLKPRVCTSRRSVTIRLDRGYKVRAARVLLNGHLVRVVRHHKKVTSTINLRSRARGTYTVRTVVVTKGNKIRIGTRRYTTCAVAKKH